MKLRLFALILIFIMLAACTPNVRETTAALTDNTQGTQNAQTPQESEEPSPQLTPAAPVEALSISSADEWNAFAADFNDSGTGYADFITITINAALDFSDKSFVPLYSGFSGIIRGASELQFGDLGLEKTFPGYRSGTGPGFYNISSIETVVGEPVSAYGESVPMYPTGSSQSSSSDNGFMEFDGGLEYTSPDSLFGLVSESLTIENLIFAYISSDKLSALFSHSCGNLSVQNTEIRQCRLPLNGKAMFADNAGGVSVEGLLVYDCSICADTYAAGLVGCVAGDTAFKDIYLYHFDFELSPDLGGSGYALAFTGMLSRCVYGNASFENIALYGCKALTAGTAVLCSYVYGEIEKCRNISAERSSLLGYPRISVMFPPSELMFYYYTQEPVFEENVSFKDCLLNAYVYDPTEEASSQLEDGSETYISRGYSFINCSFVTLSDS